MTSDELLTKHIEAMGGEEKWNDLLTYRLEVEKENGLLLTQIARKPNQCKLIFTRKGKQFIKSFNGKYGFIENNGNYESMRPGEAIEMSEEVLFFEDLIQARANGYELILEGEEQVGYVPCYKLKLIKSEKDTQWYWINQETHLIEQTGEYSEDKAHEGNFYKTRFIGEQVIEGYRFPRSMELIINDLDTISMSINRIEVNPEVDEREFDYIPASCRDLVVFFQDVHREGHLKAFTFIQETIRFKKDGKTDTSTWYEAIQYPDQFRIDFGALEKGNSNLYRADSVYAFRDGELVGSRYQQQEFLLIEGGIHFYHIDSVLARLAGFGVDITKFSEGFYEGRPVYILGGGMEDSGVPQIWIDAERHYVVRRISMLGNSQLVEVIYSQHQLLDGHWVESWLEFKDDKGNLIQTEKYQSIDVKPEIPANFFEPDQYGTSHWYSN